MLSKYKIQHDGNILLIVDSVDEVKESLEERQKNNFRDIVEKVSNWNDKIDY